MLNAGELKISVITVCRNSAGTIRDTLESVCAQTHGAVEHILVDGASTDDTLKIIREFDHVAQVVSEPDQGIYDAMNKGIRHATGAVVGFLNADDRYAHPEVLQLVAAAFYEKKQRAAVYGDLRYVHARAPHRTVRYWRSGSFQADQFRYGWMPPHPTFFARREMYETLGGYDTRLRSAADYELMLRFLYKHRIPVGYLPEVLVHMRTGGLSNRSLRNRWRANREDRLAWKINGLKPAFYTLWLKPLRKIPQYRSIAIS